MAIFADQFQTVVFIVSSGRTGTKALAHHLNRCYDHVHAVHEPSPSWRLRRASGMAICGKLRPDDLANRFARLRRSDLASINKPVYIESNPFLCGFLDAFPLLFSNPMILHVVRDPRTYIRSAINFGACRGLKNLANTYLPYWHPHPEQLSQSETPWKRMNPVQRMAWYWRTVNTELNRGQQLYGPRYLRMRFEDLFARDGSGLKRFTQWVNLPWKDELLASANSEKVNASRGTDCPPFKQWPPELQQQALHYCRDLMDLYGYELAPAGGITPCPT